MPIFYVKQEFIKKLESGAKKAELRIGENWKTVAERIMNGKIRPIAIFKSGSRVVIREIYRIEIYKSLKRALSNGRWKLLGLNAKTFHEAILEVRKLYKKGGVGPTVIFWIRKPKNLDEKVLKELDNLSTSF